MCVEVTTAGQRVQWITADQGANNHTAYTTWREKIYALSDPPHLKKYWKQYAEKQIFNAEWQIIWEDIADFCELEK